jgi:hypothetical protein
MSGFRTSPEPFWPFGDQLGHEPLGFAAPLDLDGDRVDCPLDGIQSLSNVGQIALARSAGLGSLVEPPRELEAHDDRERPSKDDGKIRVDHENPPGGTNTDSYAFEDSRDSGPAPRRSTASGRAFIIN